MILIGKRPSHITRITLISDSHHISLCRFALTLYWILLIRHELKRAHANGGPMQSPTDTRKPLSLVLVLIFLSALVLSGCSSTTTATRVQPSPQAIVRLTVSPSAVMPGQSATITWSSANATSCTASGAWSGTLATSGSSSVILQTSSVQSYSLNCSGAGLPGTNTATLAVSQAEGGCKTAAAAVRAHSGRRTAHKLTGAHS
jgi:hypothetical protein